MNSKCPQCEKNVYMNDEVRYDGIKYHKTCLKCFNCSRTLNVFGIKKNSDNFYCELCFNKCGFAEDKWAQKPRQVSSTPTSIPLKGDRCPVCEKAVYIAEAATVLGKVGVLLTSKFHKLCLKCANCSKLLDTASICDREQKIYCKSCYGKIFGPKGYGYGGGAGALTNTQ